MSTSTKVAKASKIPTKTEPQSEEKWLREAMRVAEAQSGYVAIYIIAPIDQRWPVAFGVCSDPVAAYHSYQKGWWEEHALCTLLWTPGKPAAERVKRRMAEKLLNHRKFFSRSWYDLSADQALKVLLQSAKEEGVSLFDEVERQRRFATAARMQREDLEGVVRSTRRVLPTPQAAPVIPIRSLADRKLDGQKVPR